jgi:hypothetical protein
MDIPAHKIAVTILINMRDKICGRARSQSADVTAAVSVIRLNDKQIHCNLDHRYRRAAVVLFLQFMSRTSPTIMPT